MNNTLLHLENSDTVTGLPTRRAFGALLQAWLLSQPRGSRYVALSISLPIVRSRSGSKGIDSTLQDLLAFRASVLLGQQTRRGTLMGRADQHSLFMVQPCGRKLTGSYREFVRRVLGNLGGLIDDPNAIAVTSIVSSVSILSANEVLRRLQTNHIAEYLYINADIASSDLQTTPGTLLV